MRTPSNGNAGTPPPALEEVLLDWVVEDVVVVAVEAVVVVVEVVVVVVEVVVVVVDVVDVVLDVVVTVVGEYENVARA